ncbi:methyltransferase domain-containing protein [Saccharopolyspora indica]|uniref:class I SAM-dependent methyltransferase n=1 Tax=Saccharopolyspora indica TaxID=1229659 RepID=UPI0022EA15AC|nr:class I SAM-dependent methyltransferase [Saccharopolyspora indica]MDA3643112.1 methyltransferase domain-containing protein [Saccharopolyspora indica]
MSDARVQETLRNTFDAVALVYDHDDVEYFQPVGRRLVELAGIGAGQSVLDIGCGRGAALFPAADAVGPGGEVVGIDLSEAMTAATGQEADRRGLRQVSVRAMDGQNPDFPPESFDAVIGSMSVHMVPDTAAAFRAYHRFLRPGGRLAVSAPVSVQHPEPAVFGLGTIAKWSAEYGSGTQVYPQSDAFGGAQQVLDDLRAAGFRTITVHDEELLIRTASGQEFVAWTWTHGMRLFWEKVPEHQRAGIAAEIAAEVESHRDPTTSGIAIPSPVRYVLAERGR